MQRKPSQKAVKDLLNGLVHLNLQQKNNYVESIKEFPELYYALKAKERLNRAFKHYDIDPKNPNCWLWLACALMKPPLEGYHFRPKKKTGRPSKWDYLKYEILYCDVDLLMLNNRSKYGYNIGSACKTLAKRKRWYGYTPKTLQTRYSAACKHPLVKLRIEEFRRLAKEFGDF